MVIFTFECFVKIVAQGLILHRNAYLWSMWNILDFVVVGSGCAWIIIDAAQNAQNTVIFYIFRALAMMPFADNLGGINLKGLRTVRVIRPLKLVSGIPS